MRTSSSSSLATAAVLDEVVAGSSSTTVPSENPEYMRTLRQYGRYFSTRLVQVVVQSRTNEKFNLECTLPSNSPDWFNLRIDELGEVSAQVKRSISRTFSIDEEDQQTKWANDIRSQLYLQLSVMLRSAMVAARMTPLHRYYVKKQSCDTFVILYKLGEGLSELDLGTEAKRLELGRFPTPAGAFRLEVAYRTQMERALSPRDGHESPNQPATSPPDPTNQALTPARSRSTSLASDGDPASGSPKPKQHLVVPKNMPFANLLTVSYTGVLFPLPEEAVGRKKCPSESAIAEGNGHTPSRCGSFSRLLGDAAVTAAASTSKAENKEVDEENRSNTGSSICKQLKQMNDDNPEVGNAESEEAAKTNVELDSSERTLVDRDSDSQSGSVHKGDKCVEDQSESVTTIKHSDGDPDEVIGTSDDDSFVKIPLFGRTSGEAAQEGELDVHLTEFMTSCKAPPPLLAVPQEWDTLNDIQSLLEQFSLKQSVFDKFVAEVREHGDGND
ncbi:unnamed protein product [Angiostrongylus costaricensis]|uniref:Autophagy-related protein 13 n=1 Tax=Angiostrongylus costaricensis TaxID=334426 RepID=A0A0R3PYU4_ANGCS|nr:unnamed protein product [Angiostrongylus costaricensis]